MEQQGKEAFIGLDVSKLHNAVAIADAGRHGEIRYLGEFDNTQEATRKLATKLAAKYDVLHFATKQDQRATACIAASQSSGMTASSSRRHRCRAGPAIGSRPIAAMPWISQGCSGRAN